MEETCHPLARTPDASMAAKAHLEWAKEGRKRKPREYVTPSLLLHLDDVREREEWGLGVLRATGAETPQEGVEGFGLSPLLLLFCRLCPNPGFRKF